MSEKSGKSVKHNDSIQRLLERGAEMLGSGANAVTSGAIALLVGGPEGLAIGGVLGKGVEIALNNVGQEISSRQLAPREETRVGAAFAYATAEINRRLEEGEGLRDDDFFEAKQAGRSDAEEVMESVLLKVQREPEEKKIPYMGYLFAGIAFDPEVSIQMAHQLTKAAEGVTYRQFCILRLCVDKENYQLRDQHYENPTNSDRNLYQILHECHNLYHSGYIYHKGSLAFGGSQAFVPTDLNPRDMILNGLGVDLFHLMRLCLIPDADIIPIAEQLK